MNILSSDSTDILRGWNASEDFTVTQYDDSEATGIDANITSTIDGITYAARTTTGTINKTSLSVSNNLNNPPIVLTSETPDVCEIALDGRVSYVSSGVCNILARGQTGTRRIGQAISVSGAATLYDSITGRAAGSLRKYLYDQQIAALAGVTAGAASQRAHINGNNYTTNGGLVAMSGGTYGAVNTNNFLRAQSKAGFAGFNTDLLDQLLAGSGGGSVEWKAWISQHHYLTWSGHSTTTSTGPSWRRPATDHELLIYYSATTWTGSLCKVLPPDFLDYMPTPQTLTYGQDLDIPVWTRMYNTYIGGSDDPDAERRWVMPASSVNRHFASTDPRFAYQKQKATGTPFVNGGDSGSPVFLGINGDLIIHSHTGGEGSVGMWAQAYHAYIPQINAGMNDLATVNSDPAAGSYSVGVVDLTAPIAEYPSGFTKYL